MKKLLQKHKDKIMYLIVGFVTTGLNWIVYAIATHCHLNVNTSNVIAWIAAVIFAYIANKLWVFHSDAHSCKEVTQEIIKFVSSRIASGVLEVACVPFLIWCGLNQTILGIEGMLAKVITSAIVMAINYITGKIIVFSKQKYQKG